MSGLLSAKDDSGFQHSFQNVLVAYSGSIQQDVSGSEILSKPRLDMTVATTLFPFSLPCSTIFLEFRAINISPIVSSQEERRDICRHRRRIEHRPAPNSAIFLELRK